LLARNILLLKVLNFLSLYRSYLDTNDTVVASPSTTKNPECYLGLGHKVHIKTTALAFTDDKLNVTVVSKVPVYTLKLGAHEFLLSKGNSFNLHNVGNP